MATVGLAVWCQVEGDSRNKQTVTAGLERGPPLQAQEGNLEDGTGRWGVAETPVWELPLKWSALDTAAAARARVGTPTE